MFRKSARVYNLNLPELRHYYIPAAIITQYYTELNFTPKIVYILFTDHTTDIRKLDCVYIDKVLTHI